MFSSHNPPVLQKKQEQQQKHNNLVVKRLVETGVLFYTKIQLFNHHVSANFDSECRYIKTAP